MWAVALGALLPVLSQAAVRLTDQADWVEVCTSTGMAWVHAESGQAAGASPDESVASALSGCAWCLSHAGGMGLPPSLAPSGLPLAAGAASPLSLATVRVAHRGWPSALSRAPPLPT
jgi:hypothetical protein